jgi:hypothetical protein
MGKSITDLSAVTTVGLDLAKHVFQVHGVDASGRVVVAKAMRRNKLLEFFALLPAGLVGLEASGSAHHWARELIRLGHEARMMPPWQRRADPGSQLGIQPGPAVRQSSLSCVLCSQCIRRFHGPQGRRDD